jgi:hypothetical protein
VGDVDVAVGDDQGRARVGEDGDELAGAATLSTPISVSVGFELARPASNP